MLNFIIQSRNCGTPPSKKKWGPKTCKIRRHFGQLQTSMENISGTEQFRKSTNGNPSRVRQKSPVNYSINSTVIEVDSDPPKSIFFRKTIIRQQGLKFVHTPEIDQSLLAHTSCGTGVPPTFFKNEHLKNGLQFSVSP